MARKPVVFLITFVGMTIDADSSVLINSLSRRGIDARSVCWDDPLVDWSLPDLCVIKSASNYMLNPPSFFEWVKEIETKCILWNSSEIINWNYDKHYLLMLEKKGIPIPPTIIIDKNDVKSMSHYLDKTGWNDIVIKPTISAGSFGLRRFHGDFSEADAHIHQITKEGYVQHYEDLTWQITKSDVIIQPFIPEIAAGESSLIFFGGKYSHSVIKKSKSGDFRSHPIWGATVEKYIPTIDELKVAKDTLDAVGRVEYARLDIVRTSKGPLLIEVELIEPFLFFDMFPETAEVYADHIKNSLL